MSDHIQPEHEQSHEATDEQQPIGQTSPPTDAEQPEQEIQEIAAEDDGPGEVGEVSGETPMQTDAAPSPEMSMADAAAESGGEVEALVPAFATQLRRANDVIVAAERAAASVGLTTATTGGRIECDYDMVADTLICRSVSFDLEF